MSHILVSDLFLLPWFIFLPNDCHSWGVCCNMTVQAIHWNQKWLFWLLYVCYTEQNYAKYIPSRKCMFSWSMIGVFHQEHIKLEHEMIMQNIKFENALMVGLFLFLLLKHICTNTLDLTYCSAIPILFGWSLHGELHHYMHIFETFPTFSLSFLPDTFIFPPLNHFIPLCRLPSTTLWNGCSHWRCSLALSAQNTSGLLMLCW